MDQLSTFLLHGRISRVSESRAAVSQSEGMAAPHWQSSLSSTFDASHLTPVSAVVPAVVPCLSAQRPVVTAAWRISGPLSRSGYRCGTSFVVRGVCNGPIQMIR